jgi:hypothetical protein
VKTRKTNRGDVREATITFPTTAAEKKKIQKAANEKGITMSAFIRLVLNEYLR